MGMFLESWPSNFSLSTKPSEEKKKESKEPAQDNVERVRGSISASFDANDAREWNTNTSGSKRTFTHKPKGRYYRADFFNDVVKVPSTFVDLRDPVHMREPLVE